MEEERHAWPGGFEPRYGLEGSCPGARNRMHKPAPVHLQQELHVEPQAQLHICHSYTEDCDKPVAVMLRHVGMSRLRGMHQGHESKAEPEALTAQLADACIQEQALGRVLEQVVVHVRLGDALKDLHSLWIVLHFRPYCGHLHEKHAACLASGQLLQAQPRAKL